MNPCVIATPFEDTDGDDRWIYIHKRFVSELREKDPDVIFLGDGVLESLAFTDMWRECFSPLHCLNLSIRQDKVQNLLWRIQNGILENVKPKIVVLQVGTNNIENTAEEIADGISEAVTAVRTKLPDTYIILPSLLPRGHLPNKLRDKMKRINELMAERCVALPRVQTVTTDKGVLQPDGSLSHLDMYDYLHVTNNGAHKCYEPVHDLISQILNENEGTVDLTPSE